VLLYAWKKFVRLSCFRDIVS